MRRGENGQRQAPAWKGHILEASRRQALEICVLAACGCLFLATNSCITFIDDETTILSAAVAPVRQTLAAYWTGAGQHEHPPLYDLLLHFWLRITGGAFAWLRLPSIVFYLIGLWMLARAAGRLGGSRGARGVLWLGVLWPYGFHYGRLAAWYSFCFLITAGLTLAYLRLAERPSAGRWLAVLLLAAALIYTNYLGWATLACLTFDLARGERANPRRVAGPLFGSGLLLALAYTPMWHAFLNELRSGPSFAHSLGATVLFGGFNLYVAFVSESVAPWVWLLGVPAGLCVVACLGLTLKFAAPQARRFLLYALLLLAAMTAIGVASPKRLLPVAAWLLLPVGVTLGTLPRGRSRVALAAALAGILLVGWFGILQRRFYAAPRFIEPWQQVAAKAAGRARSGALVIANNPSFFFYLTYALRVPVRPDGWRFMGEVAYTFADSRVFDASDWIENGRPLRPEIYFVRGAPGPPDAGPAWEAEQWLDRACHLTSERLLLPDPGAQLKARFLPELGELYWRVRIREYSCFADTENSR